MNKPAHHSEQQREPAARSTRYAFPALCLLALLASLPVLGDWGVLSPDSYAYLETARTIRETGGLPEQAMMRPPGYPLILAPLLAFGPVPFLAVRLLNMVCLCATACLTFVLFRKELGRFAAWMAAAFAATSPILLRQQVVVLSEPLFTPLSLGALIVLSVWWRNRSSTWATIVLAGVLISLACLCRSTGLVLIPLALLALLPAIIAAPRREIVRAAVLGLLAIGPVTAYQMQQRAYSSGQSYSQMWLHARAAENTDATGLALQAQRLGRFGPMRLVDLKESIVPTILGWRFYAPPLHQPTAWLVGGLCVFIAAARFLREPSVIDAYFLATLTMLALWPWDEGVRLVSPLIPLLFGYAAWVISRLRRTQPCTRSSGCRGTVAAFVVLACAVQLTELGMTQARLRDREAKASGRFADMQNLARWLRTRAEPGSTWTGVARDGDPTKVLMLGGAYLSRTSAVTVDLAPQEVYEHAGHGSSSFLIQEGITYSTEQECAMLPMQCYDNIRACGFSDFP